VMAGLYLSRQVSVLEYLQLVPEWSVYKTKIYNAECSLGDTADVPYQNLHLRPHLRTCI
jgi:hypothetical protein